MYTYVFYSQGRIHKGWGVGGYPPLENDFPEVGLKLFDNSEKSQFTVSFNFSSILQPYLTPSALAPPPPSFNPI